MLNGQEDSICFFFFLSVISYLCQTFPQALYEFDAEISCAYVPFYKRDSENDEMQVIKTWVEKVTYYSLETTFYHRYRPLMDRTGT